MADIETPPPSRRSHYLTNLKESAVKAKQDLLTIQRYNLRTFTNHPLSEISGSFGDLGTLLPILIALTVSNTISLSSTLIFSGLANIYTGILFGIPLPVQPMKAIAAVALAQNFNEEEIASAGLFLAAAIGFLSISGLIGWFTKAIPIPVVKGIQVGTGLSLIMSAGTLYSRPSYPEVINPTINAIILILAFLGLLASSTFRRIPYALILLLISIIFVIFFDLFWEGPSNHSWSHTHPGFSIWHPHTFVPSWPSFRRGMVDAGIGQLPLTTLNSVIAVAFLVQDLLPNVKAPSTTSLGLSVMASNLVGCWFGAMPVCHGSGGLAAQYRFGARSGASIIVLGLVKLLLGLFASEIALHVFVNFPSVLLCILVIAAGLELVKVGESLNTAGARDLSPLDRASPDGQGARDESDNKRAVDLTEEERKRRWAVMFMTVAGILAFKNDAVGFLAGMLCHWSFQWQDSWEERRSRREGRIRLNAGTQDDSNIRGI
ncbi:hypothetical protein OEA41_006566 [Lepraria neglecta]|uniref:Sulfate transporter n=1 Tax=Lepraria neglecta TaxID=209136 RepID=A0AAD9ZAK3_9LECA|nr:hypothetical protein OEA41_006566 [Lepraria neglecta]